MKNINYVAQKDNESFGKTNQASFTPEIRATMKELYHDKFGLFIHFGPYAQLEGVWRSAQ